MLRSDPELAPIRIESDALQAVTTCSTLSGPPMLPGLMRRPRRRVDRLDGEGGVEVDAVMTGNGESRTIFGSASASSSSHATRTTSHPADASAASAPSWLRRRASSSASSTARRQARRHRSRCASISSRPLLARVAESIVIFGPMFHVGWASASAGVTSASSSAERPRNGPPEAVSTSESTDSVLLLPSTGTTPSAPSRRVAAGLLPAPGRRAQAHPRRRGSPCSRAQGRRPPRAPRGWPASLRSRPRR